MERLGADAFDGTRLDRSGTWVVAFLAGWCGFCRSFEPKFESLRGGGPYEIAVADLTDEESPLWERFDVDVVPSVAVFREGALVFRRDGRLGWGLGKGDLDAVRAALANA
ncbi:MAG: thioredoxin family protein [Thermoplasmata archaeon]